ncbi:hypothetical protein BV22DRAFT_1123417 [Leucogyrophana mollusca]|uniref:Uncharacterized protein n=1 Tax=Leucogyrophana mollusca TaxID=85980 RepID=A0ACB8B0X2_9AGAM|nr:hypothetical protein BV22DRAFT_1123417 [Leucogyrophana mollusca]
MPGEEGSVSEKGIEKPVVDATSGVDSRSMPQVTCPIVYVEFLVAHFAGLIWACWEWTERSILVNWVAIRRRGWPEEGRKGQTTHTVVKQAIDGSVENLQLLSVGIGALQHHVHTLLPIFCVHLRSSHILNETKLQVVRDIVLVKWSFMAITRISVSVGHIKDSDIEVAAEIEQSQPVQMLKTQMGSIQVVATAISYGRDFLSTSEIRWVNYCLSSERKPAMISRSLGDLDSERRREVNTMPLEILCFGELEH